MQGGLWRCWFCECKKRVVIDWLQLLCCDHTNLRWFRYVICQPVLLCFFPSWLCWSCNLSGLPFGRLPTRPCRQVLPTLASLYGPEAVAEAEKSSGLAQVGAHWFWEIEKNVGKLNFERCFIEEVDWKWCCGLSVGRFDIKLKMKVTKIWQIGGHGAHRQNGDTHGWCVPSSPSGVIKNWQQMCQVSWCHGNDRRTFSNHKSPKFVDVWQLPGPWQASKPRCSMPTRLGKADLDGLGITALSWRRAWGIVICKVRVLKLR